MNCMEENEEEALQWAALERLPTYNRLRQGLLAQVGGGLTEVDVKKLEFQEKNDLVERLLKVGAVDNKEFLLKLKDRLDRVGINIPTIEVRFEHLHVGAQVYIGRRALPTIYNSVLNTIEGFLSCLNILPRSKRRLQILQDVSGIIKPGRMTLLLGPPSSGKTTLMLALAGRLGSDLKVTGAVSYNGHSMKDFVPQRSSAYISQHDLHIPEMTVRETLAFSGRCQGVGTNFDMLIELLRREKAANIKPNSDIDIYMKAAAIEDQKTSIVIDYILKILGLEACADTMVGNQIIRGISGGERKRLTTGEMLVGPTKAFFMDEISTGLDSSTTFQIVNSIRQTIHILKGTTVISLLQPAPEVYDLFDDLILLSDGLIIYQGPTENVLEFFESVGFKCPERKGVADYLQEVTSRRDQEQYWMNKDEPYYFVTAKNFAEAFQAFHIAKNLNEELSLPFDKSKSHSASLTTKVYGVEKKRGLFKACVSREILLMKRHSFIYKFKMAQTVLTALIAVTVFIRTKMPRQTVADGEIFMGSLFFAIVRLMFSGMTEIIITVGELPVFYKQRDFLLYPAWAYSLPKWILKIPISVMEAVIWVTIIYYGIGYDSDLGRFFKQWLLLLTLHQMASGLYRLVAGVSRKMVIASTLAPLVLSMYLILGGFILSRDVIKKWWIWGYWLSPVMYAQNAMAVNEFLGKSWSHVTPNSTHSLGVQVLKSRGLFITSYWYPLGISALLGFCFLFNFLFTVALTYLNPPGKPQAIITEKDVQEENVRGQARELQTRDAKRAQECMTSNLDLQNNQGRRGMVLPFEPLSITFDEIRYSIDMPQKMKKRGVTGDRLELLKGINGAFRPGVLTALMGVSGAGKTTLMDVLAGRKTAGYIQGAIKISGHPKNQETFARISGYAEQSDIHSPHVTVYESLLFSARLRLPSEVDSATKEMFIWEVMELVELTSIKEALVGIAGVNGLSREQRKRLTIALELVANPSIIFMDEPTSGLDARAAAIVMRTVKNTVNTGRTVVCTIHQPSIDIFDAFDELLLLKRGGEEIYSGPLGPHGQHLIKYFEAIDGVSKIKNGQNPATWMMEISSTTEEARLGINFVRIYKQSEQYRVTKALIKELSVADSGSKEVYFPKKYSQTFLTQSMACVWKQYWSYWRNIDYNGARIFYSGLLGLLIGSVFWNLDSTSLGGRLISDKVLFTATIRPMDGETLEPAQSVSGDGSAMEEDESTALDLTSYQLHDLESVELPLGLIELDLTANRLSKLDPRIAQLKSLKKLSLRQNLFDDAGVDPLSAWAAISGLEELVLRDNKLMKIPDVSIFKRLLVFDVSFNEISSLNGLSKVVNTLRELYVSKNEVPKMEEIEHFHQLQILELGSNRLRVMENLHNLTKLQELWLGRNRIRVVDLCGLKCIKKISLQSNRLTSMKGFEECVALEELYLSHNGISKMEGLSTLVNLRVLDVSSNKLTSVDDIENLTKLEDLWLNDNQITLIEGLAEAVAGSREKLTTIYLENNPCAKTSNYIATVREIFQNIEQIDSAVFG